MIRRLYVPMGPSFISILRVGEGVGSTDLPIYLHPYPQDSDINFPTAFSKYAVQPKCFKIFFPLKYVLKRLFFREIKCSVLMKN
jgi:hypothetical protein